MKLTFSIVLIVLSVWAYATPSVLAQGGDPVPVAAPPPPTPVAPPPTPLAPPTPPPPPTPTPMPVVTPAPIPVYIQANPSITSVDQRSGLVDQATKVINLTVTPVSLTVQTVKPPTIVNVNLLAPTAIVTTQSQPKTTVTNITPTKTTVTLLNIVPAPSPPPTVNNVVGKVTAIPTTPPPPAPPPPPPPPPPAPASPPAPPPPPAVKITKSSDLIRPDSNDLLGKRIEMLVLNVKIEQLTGSISSAKSRLADETAKLSSIPNATTQQLFRISVIKDELSRLPNGHLVYDEKTEARRSALTNELTQLQGIANARQAQQDMITAISKTIEKSEGNIQTLLAQRKILENQAAVMQDDLKKNAEPRSKLPVVIIASSSEMVKQASDMAQLISANLKRVDNLAAQIKMLENAPDPLSRSTLATCKKDLASAIALVQLSWLAIQRASEGQALVVNKLKQSNDYTYFVQVVNSAIK